MKARRVSHSSIALSEAASLFSNDSESVHENSMTQSASSGEKKKKKKKDKDKKEKKAKKAASLTEESSADFEDDLFFAGHNTEEPDNWAAFDQPNKVWKTEDDGWHNQVSQNTQMTEAMTASTFGSDDPPFSTIEVDHTQGNQPSFGLVPALDDSAAVAQFHAEMLQGFLKRNGHEATMAVATAVAFENFLKQQQDVMIQLTTGGDAYDREFDEEDRLDIMESIADEDLCGDSFAPDSIWDEGSFMNEKATMMAEYMRPRPKAKNSLGTYAKSNTVKPSAYTSSASRRKKEDAEDMFDEKAVMMAEFMKQGERHEEHQFDEKARMMAEYMNDSTPSFDENEREELAAYHGEMLQGFLQRHGEQDDTAFQTATAFQDFLKRQQDALAKLSAPSSDVSKSSISSRGAWSENAANGFHEEAGVPAFIGQPRHLDQAASVHSFHSEGSGGLKTRNLIAKHQAIQSGRSDGNFTAPPGTVNLKSPPESGVQPERSVQQQVQDLTVSQLECFHLMRKQAKGSFSDWWCLRFARCADFKPKHAQKVMKKFDRRFLDLNIGGMKTALRSKLLYPLPGVLGRGGLKMFYMKFQRLNPRKTTMTEFANHLVYVMNCIHETEASCVQGIGLIADMSEFSMSNFSIPLINKFLMLVQGRQVPVKMESLIFVNAPKWFGTLWSIMKQMMSTDFLRCKVHRVTFHELMRNHLPRGCETFLTNDMFVGRRPADDIVEEFITQREQIESQRILGRSDV